MTKPLVNSLVFLSCEILSKAMPFLLLPYLTRVLSVDDFGRLGLFTSLQALMIIFINISFDGAVARYYYRYGKRNFSNLIFHSFLFSALLAFFMFAIVCLFFNGDSLLLYAVVIAYLQTLFNVICTSKQCQKKVFQYALYQLGFSFLSVILTVILFNLAGFDVFTRIEAIGVAFIVCALVFFLFNIGSIKNILSLKLLKANLFYMLSFGGPLIIHQGSLYLKGQFDRILISHSFSLSQLATYTAAFQVASIANVFIMALNKALVPYYFEACKNQKITFNKLRKWFFICIPLVLIPGAILLLVPGSFYAFILGQEYNDIPFLVALFVIGFGLQVPYLLIVNHLFYLNQTKKIAYATFFSGVVHLILLFMLRRYSIELLPLAMISSNFFCLVMLFFLGMKRNEKNQ